MLCHVDGFLLFGTRSKKRGLAMGILGAFIHSHTLCTSTQAGDMIPWLGAFLPAVSAWVSGIGFAFDGAMVLAMVRWMEAGSPGASGRDSHPEFDRVAMKPKAKDGFQLVPVVMGCFPFTGYHEMLDLHGFQLVRVLHEMHSLHCLVEVQHRRNTAL